MCVTPGSDDEADIMLGAGFFLGGVFATSVESVLTTGCGAVSAGAAACSAVCCAPFSERDCENSQKAAPPVAPKATAATRIAHGWRVRFLAPILTAFTTAEGCASII